VLAGLLLALAGCAGWPGSRAADLELRSLGDDPVVLGGEYQTSLYRHDPDRGTSFIVSDIPAQQLARGEYQDGQVMHVVLLWVPKAGATPMDPTATNASVRHVVFSGGEVGIYGGAGFILPSGRLGGDNVSLDIRQATLTLLESTDGFVDVLGAARLTGSLKAGHDPTGTRRVYFNLCQRVTDALGHSRFVLERDAAMPRLARGRAAADLP
jgi:hypothetical protein